MSRCCSGTDQMPYKHLKNLKNCFHPGFYGAFKSFYPLHTHLYKRTYYEHDLIKLRRCSNIIREISFTRISLQIQNALHLMIQMTCFSLSFCILYNLTFHRAVKDSSTLHPLPKHGFRPHCQDSLTSYLFFPLPSFSFPSSTPLSLMRDTGMKCFQTGC